jgi:hypothetical protein
MAESPTFYRAFGPCMDSLKEMYEKGQLKQTLKSAPCL